MAESKNYFNVEELQSICQDFGLSDEGSKTTLVHRIVTRPAVSRVSCFRLRTKQVETHDQSVQVSNVELVPKEETRIKPWKSNLPLFAFVVVIICGLLIIAQLLFVNDKIEIPMMPTKIASVSRLSESTIKSISNGYLVRQRSYSLTNNGAETWFSRFGCNSMSKYKVCSHCLMGLGLTLNAIIQLNYFWIKFNSVGFVLSPMMLATMPLAKRK